VPAAENQVRTTTEASVVVDAPTVVAHPAAVVPVLAALSALGTLATNILLPSLPGIGASLHVSTAATTHLITVFLGIFAVGQLVVGPLSDRYGRRVPVLIGFAAFLIGSVICAVATELPVLLFGRVVQAAGACATSVLSRAIARDLFSGAALARTLTLITIAMAAAPGFSPLLGGTLDHFFGWRSSFYFVAIFAALAAAGFAASFGETHRSERTNVHVGSIGRGYLQLLRDSCFIVPATTVALIMGGLFSMFSAAPRVMIELMAFRPIEVGFFFAGTVLVVFAAGLIGNWIRERIGLDRSMQIALMLCATGGMAVLAAAVLHGSFLPFLGASLIFLLGMGVVNPLGTAQTMAPFGKNAGAASALLGFMQMLGAAIGVALSATLSSDPLMALGVVMTVGSVLALGIYALRTRSTTV
jgi:DHA1 family bicyclomycin/chloramphenicol resistance-like MFS transporter